MGSRSRRLVLRKVTTTLALIVLATILQKILWPLLQPGYFILYYPSILLATRFGYGFLAIALSSLFAEFFLIQQGTLSLNALDGGRQLRFLIAAVMIRQVTASLAKTLQATEENETRLRSVLNNALDAVVSIDLDGRVTQWNQQAESTFQYTRDEVLGKKMSALIVPPRYRRAHDQGLNHYLASGYGPMLNQRVEITAIRKNDEEFPIELNVTPILVDGKPVQFYAFIRDISQRKREEEERTRLLEQLEFSLRARDEFTTIASHELKTPITALKLQFQMAERQIRKNDPVVFSAEATTKRTQTASRLLDRMMKLIEDMLDVSRIATGKFKMSFSPVDFSKLIADVADQLAEQLNEVGTEVSLDLAPSVIIQGDSYRLEQVILNLFTNSIKYAPGAPISIQLKKEKNQAMFTFEDAGKGIEQKNLERIFDRFERAVSASNVSGLGLGLYISKEIIEEHGGEIIAESEFGKYMRFRITLPTI